MPAKAPICDLDFYADATIADTVPAYHQMLGAGPVVWLPKNNIHAICGFDAVTATLRNHRVASSAHGVSINEDINGFLRGSTLNSDPPQHDVTRAITFSPLTPKALQGVKDLVEEEAQSLANEAAAKGAFDAASWLAPHLPLTVVRELVGLGAHGKEHMLSWGAATFELMGDPRNRKQQALDRMGQLRGFLDDPAMMAALPENGWASRATRRGLEAGFDPKRAGTLMRDYIAPSLDTTISAIGYAIYLFAQNPDQWARLRADRSLMKNAIEEIVRLNTPIRAFSRYLLDDVEIGGVALDKGTRVLVVYGAANRDPARFEDPDRFDITRDVRGHVGFGQGVHACLGMHLARMEMASLFNALADRVTGFELTGPPVAAKNSTISAFAQVPVRSFA